MKRQGDTEDAKVKILRNIDNQEVMVDLCRLHVINRQLEVVHLH